MRIIVAGGRDFEDYNYMYESLNILLYQSIMDGMDVTIIEGGAKGADTLAARYSDENAVTHECFEAHWEDAGKAAGPIRNKEMVENADALVAFWDGTSRGTQHIIGYALKKGLEVHVYPYGS